VLAKVQVMKDFEAEIDSLLVNPSASSADLDRLWRKALMCSSEVTVRMKEEVTKASDNSDNIAVAKVLRSQSSLLRAMYRLHGKLARPEYK
jgi:hypothetical protein